MYLLIANIVFLTCVYFTNAFFFHGFGNGHRVRLADLNAIHVVNRSIDQPVDHFNENDQGTWQMRYFEALELWKPGGPVYLYIYGEAEAVPQSIQTGMIYDLAKETGGALYLSEHRYYGKSQPFPEMTTKTLAYLSAWQALADIAQLLREIKSLPQYKKSKIVVVGGSYAGNLAAWMRLLYRGLVDAAIASSAPVLAKKDFYEYLEIVAEDFKQYGTPGCYNNIEEQFNRYERLLQTSDGIEQLRREERICDWVDMNDQTNKQVFFLIKATIFMAKAQYGTPDDIKRHCDDYNIFSSSMLENLFQFKFLNNERLCIDCRFDNFVKSLDKAWTYQTCTEFGFFQSTSSDKQPFTKNIPVDLYYKICSHLFGPTFNEVKVDNGVNITNSIYGGLKPKVSRVVFVNGDMDPWHTLGVLKDLSNDAPAKLIHETSHCADLHSDSPQDPKNLIEARKYVRQLIKKWIGAGEYADN